MKKLFLLFATCFAVLIFSSSFKAKKQPNSHHFRSGGAAANFDAGYLGAPFAAGSCGNCHAGGTYAPTMNVQLLNLSGNAVTSYIPGAAYRLRINIVPTSGAPMYAFQTTCVASATENNINNWGAAMPTNVNNILVSDGRNYVEQNARLASGTIIIPWTAPAASSGPVRFYSIGLAVNTNFSTGGDNATPTNILNINESTVPVRLIAFDAKQTANAVNLFWETAQESNSDYFLVEHSTNGYNFSGIGKVKSNGTTSSNSKYIFSDKYSQEGTNYYRLAQTDLDGRVEYSSIIKIENKIKKVFVEISPNPVVNSIVCKSNIALKDAKYSILNNTGLTVQSGVFVTNEINVQQLAKGNYYVRIQNKNGEIITTQFIK